jgi:hypothetical protein
MVHAWMYKEGARLDFTLAIVAGASFLFILCAAAVPESNSTKRRDESRIVGWKDVSPMSGFRLLSKWHGLAQQAIIAFALQCGIAALHHEDGPSLVAAALRYTGIWLRRDPAEPPLDGVWGGSDPGPALHPTPVDQAFPAAGCWPGVFAGFVACSIPAIPGVPGGWLFISQSFLAVCFVAFTVCCTLATSIVPTEFAGEAVALINAATSLTSGLGPLVFSLLATAFLKTAYPGGAFLIFSVIILADILLCFQLPSDEAIGTDNSGPDDERCVENV